MTEAPSVFLEGTNIQWAWDATSLSLYKECPRKYYYKMIENWRPNDSGVHLTFGQFYHASLEAYDHERIFNGASHQEGMRAALRTALTLSWGWESDNPNKNRHTLVRSVVWYLDKFENDPMECVKLANGLPAVELSFRMELPYKASVDQPYILCGYIDKVVDFAGGQYVLDRKTSKSTLSDYFFEQFSPDNQFSLYSAVTKVLWNMPIKGVIIDAAQIAVGFTDFKRGMTFRNDWVLEEWMDDTKYWIAQARWSAENNIWPMNDKSCHKYAGCEFREICRLAPAVRQKFLETGFHKEVWNPLTLRGGELA